MARLYGRAPKGLRPRAGIPHGAWKKTTTIVAGLRLKGVTAAQWLDASINDEALLAYVIEVLAPTLKPGDIVMIDNLSSHKSHPAREAIEAGGGRHCRSRRLTVPPQSDETAFSTLKALLR